VFQLESPWNLAGSGSDKVFWPVKFSKSHLSTLLGMNSVKCVLSVEKEMTACCQQLCPTWDFHERNTKLIFCIKN
jgi:hypothetical protein